MNANAATASEQCTARRARRRAMRRHATFSGSRAPLRGLTVTGTRRRADIVHAVRARRGTPPRLRGPRCRGKRLDRPERLRHRFATRAVPRKGIERESGCKARAAPATVNGALHRRPLDSRVWEGDARREAVSQETCCPRSPIDQPGCAERAGLPEWRRSLGPLQAAGA